MSADHLPIDSIHGVTRISVGDLYITNGGQLVRVEEHKTFEGRVGVGVNWLYRVYSDGTSAREVSRDLGGPHVITHFNLWYSQGSGYRWAADPAEYAQFADERIKKNFSMVMKLKSEAHELDLEPYFGAYGQQTFVS